MSEITLKAYAKINLCLDVTGKRSDGYHEVKMVMQQVDLFDEVRIEVNKSEKNELHISSNLPYLPTDRTNLAYKAARLMQETFQEKENQRIDIRLKKKIPVAAGLAGGSADGAAVLLGLATLWHLPVTLQGLSQLGATLGADVPFCIMGQAAKQEGSRLYGRQGASTCALATGIGEILTPLPPLDWEVLLVKPGISVSTAAVYGGLVAENVMAHPRTEVMIAGLKENNLYKVKANLINVLETVTLQRFPEVLAVKKQLSELPGCYGALMSGSGPTVFAIYTNHKKAVAAYEKARSTFETAFLVRTLLPTA